MGTTTSSSQQRRASSVVKGGVVRSSTTKPVKESRLHRWMKTNRSSLDQLPSVLISLIMEYAHVGSIIIIGGENAVDANRSPTTNIWSLDPLIDRHWYPVYPSLPSPRSKASAVSIDSSVYITAGSGTDHSLMLDMATMHEWQLIQPEIPFTIGEEYVSSSVGRDRAGVSWWHCCGSDKKYRVWHSVYNNEEKRWYSASRHPTKEVQLASFVCVPDPKTDAGYYLLMIGGVGITGRVDPNGWGDRPIREVYRYDPEWPFSGTHYQTGESSWLPHMKGKWSRVVDGDLPRERANAVAVYLSQPNAIYVIGGYHAMESALGIECYSIRTSSWTTTKWRLPDIGFSVVGYDGRYLIIIADPTKCTECWILDVLDSRADWKPLPSLPSPLRYAAAVAV